ncbi:MAG: hypothetical protein U0905_10490 [Pirellulales bacterium]
MASESSSTNSLGLAGSAAEIKEVIQANDRVAWLGGRLWEEMQDHGELEAILAGRLAGKHVSFRNVAWSGDDVEGRARGVFGTTEDGYKRRLVDLEKAEPTLVFVAYGFSEALDDSWSLERFEKGLIRLISDLKKKDHRLVLLAPGSIPEGTSFPASRLKHVQQRLTQFAEKVQQIAKAESLTSLQLPTLQAKWTDDGMVPKVSAVRDWALSVADVLVPTTAKAALASSVELEAKGEWKKDSSWVVKWEGDAAKNQWKWKETAARLPDAGVAGRVVIRGLPAGQYRLMIDGQLVGRGDAGQWREGLAIAGAGVELQREALRQKIVDKDITFLHRYRPQNETYLFLFRKHEQGNNAPEVEKFSGLAKELDSQIQALATPKSYEWELIRE